MKHLTVALLMATLSGFCASGAMAVTIPLDSLAVDQFEMCSWGSADRPQSPPRTGRRWHVVKTSVEVPGDGSGQQATAEPLLTFNGRYAVAVNYDLPLEEMIKAGGYDHVNQSFNTLSFPVAERGLVNTEVTILKLNGTASTEEILAMMERNGFRPATLTELLALCASFRDLTATAALGSVRRKFYGNGHCARNVPTLARCGTRRDLEYSPDLAWGWSEFYQFAAVRKMSVKVE